MRPAHQPSAAYGLVRENAWSGLLMDGLPMDVARFDAIRRLSPFPSCQRVFIALRRNRRAARGGSARFRPFRAWAGTCTLPSRDATPRSGGKDLPAERRLLRGCKRMTTCPCENFPQGGTGPAARAGPGEVGG